MNHKNFFFLALCTFSLPGHAITKAAIRSLPQCKDLTTPTLTYKFTPKDHSFPDRGVLYTFRGEQSLSCVYESRTDGAQDSIKKSYEEMLAKLNQGEFRLQGAREGRAVSTVSNVEKKELSLSPAPMALFDNGTFWQAKQTVLDEDDEVTLQTWFNIFGGQVESEMGLSLLSTRSIGEGDNENLLKKMDYYYLRKVSDSARLYVLDFKRIMFIIKPDSYGPISISEKMFLEGMMGVSGARASLNEDYKKDLEVLVKSVLSKL